MIGGSHPSAVRSPVAALNLLLRSTGLKMFFILTLALLPLGIIALAASLQAIRTADLEKEALLRVAVAQSARKLTADIHSDRTAMQLTVDALAERACLCPRHFSRVFKQLFHCTPADFVEELRLTEARRRLLGLHGSVESIAESVGFRSSDAFRRAFERRIGITPSAFRRHSRMTAGAKSHSSMRAAA